MVAGQQERWNAALVQAAHRFREIETGPHVSPVAIEQVPGDNNKVNVLVDRALHQVVERRARR